MGSYFFFVLILILNYKTSATMFNSEEVSEFATSEIAEDFNNDDNRDERMDYNEIGGRGGRKDDHWDAILKLAKKNQILAEKVSQLPKMIKKACKTALPSGSSGTLDQNKNMFGQERIVIIRQSSVESSSSSSESSSKSKSSNEDDSGSKEDSKAWPGQNSMEMENGFDSYGREVGTGGGYGMQHMHGHHQSNREHGFRSGHGTGHERYGRNFGRRTNRRNEFVPENNLHYMRHKGLPHRFKDHKQMHGY